MKQALSQSDCSSEGLTRSQLSFVRGASELAGVAEEEQRFLLLLHASP